MIQQSKRSAAWEFVIYSALAVCVFYTVIVTAQVLADRVKDAAALHCARASDGTDSAIADCYASRGLSLPEDL